MPARLEGKPPLTVGALRDITLDVEDLKKQFYEEGMGFDYRTGEISKGTIRTLGLEDLFSRVL